MVIKKIPKENNYFPRELMLVGGKGKFDENGKDLD